MADAIASAWVEVLPDFKEFKSKADKQMTSVLSDAGDRGGKAAKSGIGAGIIGGISGALALGALTFAADIGRAIGNTIGTGINYALDSVDLASSLSETESAIGQVFGDASQDILDFSQTANKALGATRQEVLSGAQTFGVFGKSAKLSGPELAEFSTGLVSLATDLGSFNNTSTAEAIAAIGAGLRGEAEPLRAYGILLDDASLRQEALRQGLIKTTKQALTPQQRILAAQGAIYAQTSLQQGDFARTSEGLANQQKILAASFADAQTKLGTALLPAMTTLATLANDKLVPILDQVIEEVGPLLADALARSAPAFSDLITAVAPLIPDLIRLSVEALPLLIDALILMAPLFIDNVTSMTSFFAQVNNIFALLSGNQTFEQFQTKVAGLGGSFGEAINFINDFGRNVGSMVAQTRTNIANMVGFFTAIPGQVRASIGNLGGTLYSAGRDLIKGLINGATSLLKNLGNTFANILPEAIRGPFKAALGINSPSKVFAEYGKNITQGLVGGVAAGSPSVARTMGSLVSVPNMSGAVSAVATQASVAGSGGASSAPIYTDAGHLIGWMQKTAAGASRLVFNELIGDFALDNNAGGLA